MTQIRFIPVFFFLLFLLTACNKEENTDAILPDSHSDLSMADDPLFLEFQERAIQIENIFQETLEANELNGAAFVELLNSNDEGLISSLFDGTNIEAKSQKMMELSEELYAKYPNEIPSINIEASSQEIAEGIDQMVEITASTRCWAGWYCYVGAFFGVGACYSGTAGTGFYWCTAAAYWGYYACLQGAC